MNSHDNGRTYWSKEELRRRMPRGSRGAPEARAVLQPDVAQR